MEGPQTTEHASALPIAVRREDAEIFPLPGRHWLYYLGPERSDARNTSIGYSVFDAGASPTGHVHDAAEEVIYITAGRGQLVTPAGTFDLEPGTAVFIPIGLHHATVASAEGLEMVTIFSPPVVPGAYEPTAGEGDREQS
ncbi:MAG: cupin domain-containing protein [Chloroflexota bacterium]